VETHDSVAAIVRTAKKLRKFRLTDLSGNLGEFARRLAESVFAFFIFGYIEKEARFFEAALILLPRVNDFFKRGLFLKDTLGFFPVIPEIRTRSDLVKLFDPLLLRL
jgi:hypothetical protein